MVQKKIISKQVAEAAGVAQSTVSFVLNGKGDEMRISKATQEKVLRVAKEMNYYPDLFAKKLSNSQNVDQSNIIALFWSVDFKVGEPLNETLKGIYQFIENNRLNYEVAVFPYNRDQLKEKDKLLRNNWFFGAIFCDVTSADVDYLELSDFDFYIVLMNAVSSKYSTVTKDEYSVGKLAAKLFATQKCKKASVITGPVGDQSSTLRSQGFRDACIGYDIHVKENDISHGNPTDGFPSIEDMSHIWDKTERPDALFLTSDIFLPGALRFISQKGVCIPDELAIITMHNSIARYYVAPSITSIVIPNEQMGQTAMSLLHQMIAQREKNLGTRFFEFEVKFGESCPE